MCLQQRKKRDVKATLIKAELSLSLSLGESDPIIISPSLRKKEEREREHKIYNIVEYITRGVYTHTHKDIFFSLFFGGQKAINLVASTKMRKWKNVNGRKCKKNMSSFSTIRFPTPFSILLSSLFTAFSHHSRISFRNSSLK